MSPAPAKQGFMSHCVCTESFNPLVCGAEQQKAPVPGCNTVDRAVVMGGGICSLRQLGSSVATGSGPVDGLSQDVADWESRGRVSETLHPHAVALPGGGGGVPGPATYSSGTQPTWHLIASVSLCLSMALQIRCSSAVKSHEHRVVLKPWVIRSLAHPAAAGSGSKLQGKWKPSSRDPLGWPAHGVPAEHQVSCSLIGFVIPFWFGQEN